MKMTPVDIQQQKFRVRVRGFDMLEVDKFLELVANELEELLRENNRLKEEGQKKAGRIQEMQEGERELRNAFIAAQRLYEEMKKNAGREGELILEEVKATARKILEKAQADAKQIEGELSPLVQQRAEAEAALKGILERHRKLFDTYAANPLYSAGLPAE